MLRLPAPCLVVLVGPSGSGKSTWAAAHFPVDATVSSDRLRAMVGSGEDDMVGVGRADGGGPGWAGPAASSDAFDLLEQIVRLRCARRLTTVIDTTGLDADRRATWRDLARTHRMACVAVRFDTAASVCRSRNAARARPVPATALAAQLLAVRAARR